MTDTTQGADAPNDAALFNDVTSAETLEKFENPPDPKPVDPPVEKPVEKTVEKEKEDEAALVPAQRLREANEARRQAERERDEAKAWYERQQRQPPPPQQPPPPVDLFDKPEEFVQQQFKPFIEQMRADQELQREAMSRNVAIHLHGNEKVIAAYQALEQGLTTRDPYAQYAYQQARASYDPYGVIMQWHKHAEALRTIGSDPEAYRARTIDEALNDPAVLQRAVERAKGQAAGNVARPVKSSVASSPSLGNFGAGGTDEQVAEPSDDQLFRAAVTAKRR